MVLDYNPKLPRIILLGLCSLLLCLVGVAPSRAADVAQVEVLGFSPDGSRFGFVQSGIHDGSGFPFAEIAVIDVAADRLVPGFPVRVRIETDGASREQAVSRAKRRARGMLVRHGVPRSGEELQPPEIPLPSAKSRIEVRLPAGGMLVAEGQPFPIATPRHCTGVEEATAGFELRLAITGQPAILQRDRTIPMGRGCPLRYRVMQVFTAKRVQGMRGIAVLVAYERHGFEGSDLRYLAVTHLSRKGR